VLAAAPAAVALLAWVKAAPAPFLHAAWRAAPRAGPAVVRRAEAVGTETAKPPPMSDAGVYVTEVDPITGEVDMSGLPNAMGVYAVFDDASRLQYVGLSKQIKRSVEGHAKMIGATEAGALIASVKCLEMPDESTAALKATWERWIREHMDEGGEVPPGNLPEGAPGADPRWRAKPSSARPPLSLAGVAGITTMSEAVEAVRTAVERHPVLLFMKGTPAMPQCGFSARSVGILSSIGVPFDTVNVMDEVANTGVREGVKQYSDWPTIPQLFVNGQLVGGADIIGEMQASGQLEQTLKSAVAGGSGAGAEAVESQASAKAVPEGEVRLIEDPSRPVASLLSRTLDDAFQLHTLRIVDESSQHEGDAGALEMGLTSESHFRVEVVAPEFDGLSPVQRQQKVFNALTDVMPRIHALSLVTRTPAELA